MAFPYPAGYAPPSNPYCGWSDVARKTEVIEHLIDDIDGTRAEESISFSLEGSSFVIDVNKKNAKALRADFDKWAQHARRERGKVRANRRRPPAATPARGKATAGPDPKAVRSWAASQGMEVSARGRVSAAVIEAYRQAQG